MYNIYTEEMVRLDGWDHSGPHPESKYNLSLHSVFFLIPNLYLLSIYSIPFFMFVPNYLIEYANP